MEEEINLMDYINLVKKRWLVIVSITLIVTVTAGIVSFLKPKPLVYESYSLIKVGRVKEGLLEPLDTTINEAMSDSTLSGIGKTIGKKANEIKENIRLEKTGELVKVIAQGSSPEEALKQAHTVSQYILNRHKELFEQSNALLAQNNREMEKLIKETKSIIEDLKKTKTDASALMLQAYVSRYTQLQLTLEEGKKNTSYLYKPTEELSPAFLPEGPIPYQSKTKRNVVLALMLGLMAGISWAIAADFLEKNKSRK